MLEGLSSVREADYGVSMASVVMSLYLGETPVARVVFRFNKTDP